MLSYSLRSSLIALVASAIAVSATPGLTIWTSTSSADVHGLENLRVTTTVVNTGDETLKLLNDPRSVLHSFPENTFSIADPMGSRPEFIGARVHFSPEHVVSLNNPKDFTVLTPGASIDVTHDISAAYNFTLSGPGQYWIEPSNLFTYVDADGTLKDIYATGQDATEVNLSGTLAVPRVHEQRIGFNGCSAAQQQRLVYGASTAQSHASNAYGYLYYLNYGSTRYTNWFGPYDQSRKNLVQNHFYLISSRQFSSFNYDCTCTNNWYAYVYPNNYGLIYLCGSFWTAPSVGYYSNAGTLIHESSHFTVNGGTQDYIYGPAQAQNLARTNPAAACMNADNHGFFAEDYGTSAMPPPGDLPLGALHMQ